MRINKAIAIAAALTMCVMTACGSVNESTDTAAEPDTQQETTAAQTTVSRNESEVPDMSKADSSEAAKQESSPDNVTETARTPLPPDGSFLNDDNSIIINDEEYDYDRQQVLRMAALALEQYNCVLSGDKQVYYDTVNAPALLKSDGLPGTKTDLLGDSDPESSLYLLALWATGEDKLNEYPELFKDQPGDPTDEGYLSECRKAYTAIADGMTVENTGLFASDLPYSKITEERLPRLEKVGTAKPAELLAAPGADMTYTIDILELEEKDCGTFACLDINLFRGDTRALLENCCVRLSEDGDSVLISDVRFRENPYRGMTLEETAKGIAENG